MVAQHKPWWRVDADADVSDKLVGLPSDAARWAWFRMGCQAKTQRHMGVFADRAYLRFVLGAYARHLGSLEAKGLVHEWPTACADCSADYQAMAVAGAMVVHNYRRKQVDPTNADRQARFRDRHGISNGADNGERNGNQTPSSRALSPSQSPSSSLPPGEDEPYQVSTPPEANDLRALAEELTQQSNVLANIWSGLGEKAVRLVRKHGLPAVEREWRRIAAEEGGLPELRQLVFGADEALNRVRRTPAVTETPEERDARELAELKALAARNIAAGATR